MSKHISKRFSAELHGEFAILTVENIKRFHQTPPFIREPIIPKASPHGWPKVVVD